MMIMMMNKASNDTQLMFYGNREKHSPVITVVVNGLGTGQYSSFSPPLLGCHSQLGPSSKAA